MVLFDAVGLEIEALVLAVHILEHVGLQQAVVDGGVERGALIGDAAGLHRELAQALRLLGLGLAHYLLEIPARNLGAQV